MLLLWRLALDGCDVACPARLSFDQPLFWLALGGEFSPPASAAFGDGGRMDLVVLGTVQPGLLDFRCRSRWRRLFDFECRKGEQERRHGLHIGRCELDVKCVPCVCCENLTVVNTYFEVRSGGKKRGRDEGRGRQI